MMHDISYKTVRSNRKSVALVIDNEANLIVRAPFQMDDSAIDEFVWTKKRWINEKRSQVSAFSEKYSPVVVDSGEPLMYLGDNYTIMKSEVSVAFISGHELIIPNEFDLDELIHWLKNEAFRIISERVARYSTMMGVTHGNIRLSDAKGRWGSCGAMNTLNFAWRLIMCPLSAIDYVVVHELSHITYKNHSPSFWARVKTVLPAYEEDQEWLRINKRLMEVI